MKKTLFYIVIFSFLIEAFTPFQFIPIQGISLKNIATYVSLVMLLITEVAGGGIVKKKIPLISIVFVILFGTLLNIAYLHISGHSHLTWIEHLRLFKGRVFDPIILYLIIFLLIDTKRQAHQALLTVIIVFSIINIFSFITSKLGITVFIDPDISGLSNAEDRFYGAYKNANQMAYFLCFLMPILYFFLKESKNHISRVVFFGLISFGIIGVMISGSRGGLISLSIVILATLFLYKDFKLGFLLLIFAISFILIGYFIGNDYVTKTVERASTLTQGNYEEVSSHRFTIWKGYADILMDKPSRFLVGAGFGNGPKLMVRKTGLNITPHNYYLQVLVEFGIFGVMFLFIIIFKVIFYIQSFQVKNTLLFKKVMLISVIIILFGWLFSSLIGILKYVSIVLAVGFSYQSIIGNEN